jgi:hypothetical protein
MKWCCVGFESFYGNGGHQGAGLLVGRDSLGEPEFIMQYRAADREQRIEFSSEDPIAPIIDIRLQYCPWCGRNLEKWYGNFIEDLYRPDLRIPPYPSE